MLKDLGISAIVFSVKDLTKTASFYRDVLGLTLREVVAVEAGEEERFLVAQAGSVTLVFFEREGRPGRTPTVVFGVETGIEEMVETLVRHGVEIVLPVSEAPGGLTADFLDPDGHMLSFYQSVPQDASETEA